MSAPAGVDHRQHGLAASAQRQANTVFLFFINVVLDDETKRLSGTKCMAWVFVWMDCYDIIHAHAIQELTITKGAGDSIDLHNVALFGLAVLTWFGKLGLSTAVELVKAWKGFKETT